MSSLRRARGQVDGSPLRQARSGGADYVIATTLTRDERYRTKGQGMDPRQKASTSQLELAKGDGSSL